ncbi:MAG: TrmB family transcriptional regulator [Candidatus Thorarchaeota archaeon]
MNTNTNEILEEIREFLKNSDLTTYEVNTYLSLLRSDDLTARELSEASEVPIGRIYEILEELKNKGMIMVQDSRPKRYRSIPFNVALKNLISYLENRNKNKLSFLYGQAQTLETKIYESDLLIKKGPSKTFWSTSFGAKPILLLYSSTLKEIQEEILMTGFLNESTLKVLPYGDLIYNGLYNALQRGVRIKYLWSFEYDKRPLTEDIIINAKELYSNLKTSLEDLYKLSTEIKGFEMKYIFTRIPSYYDIFDRKRILFKLQDPSKSYEIFSCLNILYPHLAEELRKTFLRVWEIEATE